MEDIGSSEDRHPQEIPDPYPDKNRQKLQKMLGTNPDEIGLKFSKTQIYDLCGNSTFSRSDL